MNLLVVGTLLVTLAITVFALARAPARRADPRPAAAQRQRVEAALSALRARPRGACVVLEDRPSRRSVRIAGARDEPLLLELPADRLDAAAVERARPLLAELGGAAPAPALQVTLGADVARGAELALRVMHEVYGLPPGFDLGVDER
jgi:hypothetical protein